MALKNNDPIHYKIAFLECLKCCLNTHFPNIPNLRMAAQATLKPNVFETIQTFDTLREFIYLPTNKKVHDDVFRAKFSKTSDTYILYQLVEKIIANNDKVTSKSTEGLQVKKMPFRDSHSPQGIGDLNNNSLSSCHEDISTKGHANKNKDSRVSLPKTAGSTWGKEATAHKALSGKHDLTRSNTI